MSGRVMRLANARLRYSVSFDSVCDIQRNGVTIEAQVPCSVEVPSAPTQSSDRESVPPGSFLVALPINYTLRYGDYIIEKGRQLRIVAVTSPYSYQVRTEGYAIDVGPIAP
jgi:hypothetical protein